jgi:TRAP-type C4-dicarboxylate transport system permease large subunit
VFTADEAVVSACVYAFVVELFIEKTMKWTDFKRVPINSAITSTTLLIIVACAACFGRSLTLKAIPVRITEDVFRVSTHTFLFFW